MAMNNYTNMFEQGTQAPTRSLERRDKTELSEKREQLMDELTAQTLDLVIDNVQINTEADDPQIRRQMMEQILAFVTEILSERKEHLTLVERQRVASAVMDEIYGFGPLTALLNDTSISEQLFAQQDCRLRF